MVKRITKSQAKQAEPEYNDFFEAMASGESQKSAPVDKGPDVTAQLAELMKRVEQLSTQVEYRPPAPTPQVQVVQAPTQQQNEEVMPDPVLDAAGYTAWLIQKADALTQARIDDYAKAQADQAGSADAYDSLWTGFLAVEGNDVWEKEPEKVQVAAMKVSKKLSAKGIDPTNYMFQNTEKFYADISKTLEADFGKPNAADDDDTDDEEVDRTAGLPTGQASPIGTKAEAGKGLPDMLGDLTAIQRKGGWY